MGSAGICNKCCNPTGKFATPPIQLPEQSEEQSESFYEIYNLHNQPHTGGFVFEVKPCKTKEPLRIKHNSNLSITTELCSKSTNVNFTSHTTSGASPYSILKQNKEPNNRENISVEKDAHLSPIKMDDLEKLKMSRVEEPSSDSKILKLQEKREADSTLSPKAGTNIEKIAELSINVSKGLRKSNKIRLVSLDRKKTMKPILQSKPKTVSPPPIKNCFTKKSTLDIDNLVERAPSTISVLHGLDTKFNMMRNGDYEPISPIAKREYVRI